MEGILWAVLLGLGAGAGILSARLYYYGKQVKHLRKQLEFLETEDSNYLLTSVCAVGKTEELILELNRFIKKMREEQQKLRIANRSYRESITSISHDIRTPLTSVKGYVQMLGNPEIPEEKKSAYVKTVERRMEDLAEMLNQLFEYARLEAGELELKMEKLNAGNLFAEAISMFYEDFVEKGCEPAMEISEKPCFIYGDSHAFLRVMENLMKNALVHGTDSYKFSLSSREGQVLIRMANRTDTIEEKDLERIFDRFYTTDQSRNPRSTGLGLAIAREFTCRMGGYIQADLKEGIFAVELRFASVSD